MLWLCNTFFNITQHTSTIATCCPLVFSFMFDFIKLHFSLHVDNRLPSWHCAKQISQPVHQKLSPQPPHTQCWVTTGWNFNFGWTSPFNEIECNVCVKHNTAHGHSFATTVSKRPRRALFSCQLGLRAHDVQSAHWQLCNAAPHGCPDANRLLQIS